MMVLGYFSFKKKVKKKLVKKAESDYDSKKLTNKRPVYNVIDQW